MAEEDWAKDKDDDGGSDDKDKDGRSYDDHAEDEDKDSQVEDSKTRTNGPRKRMRTMMTWLRTTR